MVRMSCNCNSTRFFRMFILAMTTLHVHLIPTISFDNLDRITNLHYVNLMVCLYNKDSVTIHLHLSWVGTITSCIHNLTPDSG